MSEWDYLPTPYETLVESETKHSLLIMMSIGCLLEGKVIHPIDVFDIAKNNSNFNDLLNREVKSEGIVELIRTLLQYEELRSQKKRDRLIEIIREYAKRNGTKDL